MGYERCRDCQYRFTDKTLNRFGTNIVYVSFGDTYVDVKWCNDCDNEPCEFISEQIKNANKIKPEFDDFVKRNLVHLNKIKSFLPVEYELDKFVRFLFIVKYLDEFKHCDEANYLEAVRVYLKLGINPYDFMLIGSVVETLFYLLFDNHII